MRTPEDARGFLATRWRRSWADWAAGEGSWPIRVPLQPPLEREARANWSVFTRWVDAWRAYRGPGQVHEQSRSWPSLGLQTIPVHLELADSREVAALLGHDTLGALDRVSHRWRELIGRWPSLAPALRGEAGVLLELDDEAFGRWIAALDWLIMHPDSGLHVRQLPIAGLDSKWVERHAGSLSRLLAEHRGCPPGSLESVAGLAPAPALRRMRLLDPVLRERFCGLSDISVRLDEFRRLDLSVRVALIVENQQTALACEDLPGAVVLMGGGFSAKALATAPWLSRVPVLYWGDIDLAGFQILNSLRQVLPHARSCLMDEATLLGHRELWSTDSLVVPTELPHLSDAERQLVADLRANRYGPSVRLEQERLRWPEAWAQVCAAV